MPTTLIEIIKNASNPPTDTDAALLRECILKNPLEVNQGDSDGKTPCHYAVSNFPLLVILAFEGNAHLPDNLTEDATLKIWINELRNEQIRNKNFYGFHLHDLIRKSAKMQFLNNRCRVHLGEINQKSYWKRNACHLAAMMDRVDYLVMLVQLGGDLTAEDVDGKKPLDLASQETIDLFKMKMQESSRVSIAVSNNETTVNKESKDEEQPEGFFLRVKSGLEEIHVGMMRAMSPPRTVRNRASTDAEDRKPVSPPRNPEAYERHQRALSANLSPRNNGAKDTEKAQRASSPKSYGILRRILSGEVQEQPTLSSKSGRCRSLSEGIINVVEPTSNAATNKVGEKKSVRYRDMPSSTELAAIESIEPSSPVHPSSPAAKDKSFPPTEKIISIIKNHELDQFIKYFKERRHSPNHKVSGFGRPYIIEAFLANADNIFFFLLKQGADLNVHTTTGRTFVRYILEDKTVERLEFIKKVHENIATELRINKINSYQAKLDKLEREFMQRLEEKGLYKEIRGKSKALQSEQLMELSEKYKQPIDLVTLLYDLCLGVPKDVEDGPVDLFVIQKFVAGLLINKSRILVALLNDFYPHFKAQQKLITVFIVKEIILWDQFNECYRSKTFCEEIFAHFLNLINRDGLEDMSHMLKQILDLQYKINRPMLRVVSQLENIITACESTKPNLVLRDHKLFADELRAITSRAFRALKITELVNKAWEKEEKLITAPTVVHLATTFNKISDYVVNNILTQPSEKEIITAIKFFVRAMHELINGDPRDLHSAMAISSALSKNFINRYVETFLKSSSSAVKLYLDAQQLLEFDGNYKGQRAIIADVSRKVFPWIGLLTKDFNFSQETKNIKKIAELDGRVFLYIMKLQNAERLVAAPQSLTNLPHQLQIQKEYTDPDFELKSVKSDSKAIRLNFMNLARLRETFNFYITHQLPLRVVYEGQKEGPAAVEAVFSWIKENIGSEDLTNLDEINRLIKSMEFLPNTNEVVKSWHEEFLSWLEKESLKNPKLAELIRAKHDHSKSDPTREEHHEPLLVPIKF